MSGSGEQPRKTSVSAIQGPLNPSLLKLKLLDCLRNDYEEKLKELINEAHESPDENVKAVINLLLHFAVQVAPMNVIRYIIKEKLVTDINVVDEDGNTPLHLAAMYTRADVIKYLMDMPTINDCIVNNQGKQPYESSSDMMIVQLLSELRHKFVKAKASEFKIAFDTRDFKKLESMMSQQRIRDYLDINGINPVTGDTVLIEFIKKNDYEMVEFILDHGGDPFKRNLNGKLPIDLCTTNEMKKLVKRSSSEQTMIDSTAASGNAAGGAVAPTFKGFLRKWTNFAGGYKLRWFILDEEGRLSYYKSPNDIENQCRGAIHLSRAQLRMDSSEKSKFEIIIYNKTGPPVKWHLKSNHIMETNRWVWTLQNAIRFAKDRELQRKQALQSERANAERDLSRAAKGFRQSTETARSVTTTNSTNTTNNKPQMITTSPANSIHESVHSPTTAASLARSHRRLPSNVSSNASISSTDDEIVPTTSPPKKSRLTRLRHKAKDVLLPDIKEKPIPGSSQSSVSDLVRGGSAEAEDLTDSFGGSEYEDEDDDEDIEVDQIPVGLVGSPNTEQGSQDLEDVVDDATRTLAYKKSELVLLQNQMKIQMASVKEFLKTSASNAEIEKEFVCETGLTIIMEMDNIFQQQSQILTKKEAKLNRVFERHHEISSIWERAIKDLEFEIAAREQKILNLENKVGNIKRILKPALTASSPEQVQQALFALSQQTHTPTNELEKPLGGAPISQGAPSPLRPKETVAQSLSRKESVPASSPLADKKSDLIKLLEDDEDSEDEFFDAQDGEDDEDDFSVSQMPINVNGAPSESVDGSENKSADFVEAESLTSAPTTAKAETIGPEDVPNGKEESINDTSESVNTKVDESEGNEKKLEVNGIPIVTSVQKQKYDLILNEQSFKGYEDPIRTTLSEKDDRPKISLWGILKSLVGKDMTKMALPVSFNEPTSLLQRVAEDMEYADLLDKAAKIPDSTLRMVYVAAYAASEYASTIGRIAKPFNPLLGETYEYSRPDKGYRFFVEQVSHHPPIGAAYAESPFWDYYGESNVKSKFLGRSFDIRPLGTWFLNLRPASGSIDKRGRKVDSELYTWKKVLSSVVGIIMGNPTVDNYGDMNIINHTTGDSLVLNFKQRGWRASSAYEVKGEVKDGKGIPRYAVFGHWDSTIYARRISSKPDEKNPRFLIWEANKRTEMIFHLTNFAASLNAPQPSLLPVLPPTDTRLRPDQRAMEVGQYDEAAVQKNKVEEKQRAARREREAKNEEYVPSFFTKEVHKVTGDEYWKPNETYWKLRGEGKLEGYKDIF